MAALTNEHDLTTHANYIPEIWGKMVVDFRDKNLVMANLVTRRDADLATGGDKVYFPVTSAGTAQTYTAGSKLQDSLQVDTDSLITVTVDQFKFHPFHIPWNVSDQVAYDTFALGMRQAGEAVARAVDSYLHTTAQSFTSTSQNDPSTDQVDDLELGDLTGAYTELNAADVPSTDRAWVFHPRAYKELLDISGNYFTSFDFRQGRPLETGMIGQILGSPVYLSTNCGTKSEGSPAETATVNLYMHRDAIACVMQRDVEVESGYDIDLQGTLGNARAGYGASILRGDHGVMIFTVAD